MGGGSIKYRQLSRSSQHRQALLRNLVQSLFQREAITTTWHKAKEAQRLADKVVTLAKRNTNASRSRAQAMFFTPAKILPRLFDEIRERYRDRPGGYTRVLRIEPRKDDQAQSAILELVDGPRDMRFAMTARTVARDRLRKIGSNELTIKNKAKVTRYRPTGVEDFEDLVQRFMALEYTHTSSDKLPPRKKTGTYYNQHRQSFGDMNFDAEALYPQVQGSDAIRRDYDLPRSA